MQNLFFFEGNKPHLVLEMMQNLFFFEGNKPHLVLEMNLTKKKKMDNLVLHCKLFLVF